MAKIKTIARIKPCAEPYDDFECTKSKLYVRIPELCSRDSSLYNRPRAPIVNHEFKFTHVLEASATQEDVFDLTAKDIIAGFLEGYNGTVFAYGQTGSGKTHTMEGSCAMGGGIGSEGRGIIPRALASIFTALNSNKNEEEKVTLQVSYLEIYQETGYDLLHVIDRNAPGVPTLPKVTVVEGPSNSTMLRNLSVHQVASEEAAQALLGRGQTNRKVAETPMNQRSSRSHAIFTVYMSTRRGDLVTRSKLHFVDLAGSERVCRTGVQGLQLAEAKYINLSLHHLEGVIIALHQDAVATQRAAVAAAGGISSALPAGRTAPPSTATNSLSRSWAGRTSRPYTADPPTKHHIPYRNSLLTMVLKDSLGGNCLTTMIATISMAEDNLSESISTCRFSQRVASILNAAKKNEEIDDKSMIKRLRKRVAELEAENSALKLGSSSATQENSNDELGKGLTDEEKTACALIVQNFMQGQIMDPVTAGISDPNRFRECMRVFKCLLMDSVQSGSLGGYGRAVTNAKTTRRSYHQDAPTPSASRGFPGPLPFRDDTHTLLRNYTYLRADHEKSAASSTSRPTPSQPTIAWGSPQKPAATVLSRGPSAGPAASSTSQPVVAATPYEAKQVKEAIKLNKKVTESLALQTKEQEHLKAFHSSVLEQELELAEQDLRRKTETGKEQIARQHAYIIKLRLGGAEADLIEQEQLVEGHLISRQAKMDAQLSATCDRLAMLRGQNGDGSASVASGGTVAEHQHLVSSSMDDKLRQYVKSNGKLNAKAVLDAMQQQDKLQKQIQDKIDRQRVLVLSRQLEVKESATRQKLLELKARLSQASSSAASSHLDNSLNSSLASSQDQPLPGADTEPHGGSILAGKAAWPSKDSTKIVTANGPCFDQQNSIVQQPRSLIPATSKPAAATNNQPLQQTGHRSSAAVAMRRSPEDGEAGKASGSHDMPRSKTLQDTNMRSDIDSRPMQHAVGPAYSKSALPQAKQSHDTVGSTVPSVGGSVAVTKRRQIDEVVEKYRALRLALKEKKEEILGRAAAAQKQRDLTDSQAKAASGSAGSDVSSHTAERAGILKAPQQAGTQAGGHISRAGRPEKSAAPAASASGSAAVSNKQAENHERQRGSRQRLAVTIGRYKKGTFISAAQYSRSQAVRSRLTEAGAASSTSMYLMKQMMAAAAVDAATAPRGTAQGPSQHYQIHEQGPLNERLRRILTERTMKKLVVQ